MTDIKIKPLAKNDNLQQIVNLFNTLYPQRPIKKDYLFWRYLDSPFQNKTYIAKDTDKIIGIYSGCIFPGFTKGKQDKIGFLYDLMIDPKYQNKGLVLPLYNNILQFMAKEKPSFLYCFVNTRLLPLYTRYLKWKLLKKIPFYSSQTQKIKKKLSYLDLKLDRIKYSFDTPNNINTLIEKAYQGEKLSTYILRSKKLLLWRSQQIFGKNFRLYTFKLGGKLIGFCLLKFFEDKINKRTLADLIDIVAYPNNSLYSILYIISTIIEQSSVSDITTFGFAQANKEKLTKIGFKKLDINWNLLALPMKSGVDTNFYVNMLDAEMF